MATPRSLYDELGVASTASDVEIRRAYRNLATKTHPDRGGDPVAFKRIQQAYEVLSDTKKVPLFLCIRCMLCTSTLLLLAKRRTPDRITPPPLVETKVLRLNWFTHRLRSGSSTPAQARSRKAWKRSSRNPSPEVRRDPLQTVSGSPVS